MKPATGSSSAKYNLRRKTEDTFPVRGVLITALQKHAHCPHCGSEVTPNEVIDFNITNAHNAYLKKVGHPLCSRSEEAKKSGGINREQ